MLLIRIMAYLAAVSAVGIFVTCILGGREP